ncbi:hypothetical protein ACFTXM_45700 [Streptomyces sp. NPDC056930]|uniref:hypothetical protein n=1 Tax=Streptomyces sp. NPDC056930 TaxID=3345967 RepID=UPI003624AE8E
MRLPLIARTIRGRDLTTGAVVGVARLTGCHQDGSPPCIPWAQPGPWDLELTDVRDNGTQDLDGVFARLARETAGIQDIDTMIEAAS